MSLSRCGAAILCAAIFGLNAAPAYAYLDPGTGSMLIQGLIGAIAAAALTIRLYWHKFKALFRSKKGSEEAAADIPSQSEGDK